MSEVVEAWSVRQPQVGWDAMPERSRALCITLVDRAMATIDDIDALEVFR